MQLPNIVSHVVSRQGRGAGEVVRTTRKGPVGYVMVIVTGNELAIT